MPILRSCYHYFYRMPRTPMLVLEDKPEHINNQAKQIELLENAIQQITENQRRSISLLQNIERGIKEINNQSTQK